MRQSTPIGPYWDIVSVSSPNNKSDTVGFGVLKTTVALYVEAMAKTFLCQYHGIVQDGIADAVHAFRGVNRPLLHDENMQADQDVLVYTWRPDCDWIWIGGRHHDPHCELPQMIAVDLPPRLVPVVLVRELQETDKDGVSGTVEQWSFVREDDALPGAPVGWKTRYEDKLWSRP